MILYKYVMPDRIDVLQKRRIRFTQADALNDPFEINPCILEFMEGAKEYASTKYKGPPLTHEQIEIYARQEAGRFLKRLFADYLILSLSRRNNSRLMWSHYAACHHGMALGFDSSSPFFAHWSQGKKTPLFNVESSNTRFVLPTAETWTNDNVMGLFLRKCDDWAYEDEVRLFSRSDAANEVLTLPSGELVYLFDFPGESLKEIIFGVLGSDEHRNAVMHVAREKYPHLRFFQAMLNEVNFDLNRGIWTQS